MIWRGGESIGSPCCSPAGDACYPGSVFSGCLATTALHQDQTKLPVVELALPRWQGRVDLSPRSGGKVAIAAALMADWGPRTRSIFITDAGFNCGSSGTRYLGRGGGGVFLSGWFCAGTICPAKGVKTNGARQFPMPFELYVVTFCAAALLPENLRPLAGRLDWLASAQDSTPLAIFRPLRLEDEATQMASRRFFFAFAPWFSLVPYKDTGLGEPAGRERGKVVAVFTTGTRVIVPIRAPAESRIAF